MATQEPGVGWIDLEALFRAHATPLLRLAVVLTGDRSVAEELVQDAFVRLHRSGSKPAAGTELAYLRRTVINLAHGHHRHLRVVRRRTLEPPGDEEAAETGALRRAGHHEVLESVRALPSRQRACVALRYYSDLPDAEIAATLGISVGAVKTHLHRARAALAERLEGLR